MRKFIEKHFCNAWETIKEILEDYQIESNEEEIQLNEAKEALEKVSTWEALENWYYNYFSQFSNYYYNHFELVKDSENEIKYMVLIQCETSEYQEFERVKQTINWEIKPLEFIERETNWDSDLIEAIKYSLDYFEEETPNLTQFELENQRDYYLEDDFNEYKQHLKEFIINEIQDNILND